MFWGCSSVFLPEGCDAVLFVKRLFFSILFRGLFCLKWPGELFLNVIFKGPFWIVVFRRLFLSALF
jgi:hypothetical protein